MFTGIVEAVGRIRAIEPRPAGEGVRLVIEARFAPELSIGESVCVDGACLTVTARDAQVFAADLSPETLSRTRFTPGRPVNLERSLRVGDRLGGHWVTGHVDGPGRVAAVRPVGGGCVEMRIEPPAELLPLIVEKGSIAVDGVSLTVARLSQAAFDVALIPQTLAQTTLSDRREGDWVHLEADILAKHIARWLESRPAQLSPGPRTLFEAGFA
ncbi:MAG TPA: riboflavin synthase [Limnochordia bacterium]